MDAIDQPRLAPSSTELFLDVLLPKGGRLAVMTIQCFCDESGTHGDAVNLCVAGYIIEKDQAAILTHRWNAVLEKYGLPYFHMVECAGQSEKFKDLSKAECVQVQMKMMSLIKQHTVTGVVSSINKPDMELCMPPEYRHIGPYSMMVSLSIESIKLWMKLTGYEGDAAYFFEAGADGQGEANNAIIRAFGLEKNKNPENYAGHAFLPKIGNPCLQAAELLAWQYYNFTIKSIDRKAPRLDFRALMRHPHMIKHIGAKEMLIKGKELGYELKLPEGGITKVIEESGSDVPSRWQSIAESRLFKESVFYLPTVDKPTPEDSVITNTSDTPACSGVDRSYQLACPSCFRVVAYDIHPVSMWKNFQPMKGRLVLRCYCGNFCDVPPVLMPFVR